MDAQPDSISFTLNGRSCQASSTPDTALVWVLRDEFGLTGTKVGCAAGECGACTVLLDGQPVCACLLPVGRCEARHVRTVEGVSGGAALHPIQQALVEAGAFQCGYCTPGIVMTLVALYEQGVEPDERLLKLALQGHVCRCSGYQKLIAAAMKALRGARAPSVVEGTRCEGMQP